MLAGGPGVGKSRLAMEMADYASRVGFRCLVGHCYERDEPFPYLPFAEIFESSLAQAASLEGRGVAAKLGRMQPGREQRFVRINVRSFLRRDAEKRSADVTLNCAPCFASTLLPNSVSLV